MIGKWKTSASLIVFTLVWCPSILQSKNSLQLIWEKQLRLLRKILKNMQALEQLLCMEWWEKSLMKSFLRNSCLISWIRFIDLLLQKPIVLEILYLFTEQFHFSIFIVLKSYFSFLLKLCLYHFNASYPWQQQKHKNYLFLMRKLKFSLIYEFLCILQRNNKNNWETYLRPKYYFSITKNEKYTNPSKNECNPWRNRLR